MLNILYKVVTPWAKSNRIQLIINRTMGRIANYIYPIYCNCYQIEKNRIDAEKLCKNRVIISLTSFPKRIDKVYLCINSLLRQSISANKIILWLAKSQFPDGKGIPEKLLKLKSNKFEIRFCEDLKSYKKVFYTAQDYQKDIIITVDDDTLYPEDWLENLIKTYKKYPDKVICYRAHRIVIKNNEIDSYANWIGLSPDEKGPARLLVPIGVGGVLYPPGYFDKVVFDYDLIKELCPTADDLWLKIIGLQNGIDAVKVFPNSKEWFTIRSSQKKSLMKVNVGKNLNDVSIKNLVEYYKIKI